MDSLSVYPPPKYCVDEEFRIHLLSKAALYFLRGLAAALLMPIDVLEHLRSGQRAGRRTWFSWLFPAAIYTSSLETWLLARKAMMDGRDRTGLILCCSLGLLAAGIVCGRLQTKGNVHESDKRIYGHSGWHRHRHHGDRHRGFSPGCAAESRVEDRQPRQSAAASGICCGDCRQCREKVCVRTGLAKNRRPK